MSQVPESNETGPSFHNLHYFDGFTLNIMSTQSTLFHFCMNQMIFTLNFNLSTIYLPFSKMYEDQVTYTSNSFKDDLLQHRQELFLRRQFADVTLVSDDMIPFQAHRSILGLSSQLLNSLFEVTNEPKQVLFLKGVSSTQLESILQYTYIGEISVKTDQVGDFSKVAAELGITNFLNNANALHQKAERKEDKDTKLDRKPIEKLDFLSSLEENSEFYEQKVNFKSLDFLDSADTTDSPDINATENFYDSEDIATETQDTIPDGIKSFFKEEALQLQPTEDVQTNLQENEEDTEKTEAVSGSNKDEGKNQLTEAQRKRKELYLQRKPEEPSECKVCARVFTTQRSMQRHHKSVHELYQVECEECGKKFGMKDTLNAHIKAVHRNFKYKCDICGIEKKTPKSIANHKNREHPLPTCETCNIRFNTVSEFNVHVQKEHIEKYCK